MVPCNYYYYYYYYYYIDYVIKVVESHGSDCYAHHACTNIILYADDILQLLSPSVVGLQQLLNVCEIAINSLGLNLNYRKSVCMRV